MPPILHRAAALFLIAGPAGWLVSYLIFRDTPGQDWMVFDTAAKAWRAGDAALLLDGPRFTALLNASHAAWLGTPLVSHPWVYPPYTLLLVMPFAWLPWIASYAGFQALSAAFLLWAARAWAPEGQRGWFYAGLLLCPAFAFTLGAGQNSFFSAGLVLAGFYLLPRRPWIAGMLLGLLAFKPQLAILVPVALLAAGAWATLAAATATGCLLLLASLAVPGPALWRGWLHLFLDGNPAFRSWVNEGRLHGQSVFTCLHLLGLPDRLANAGQMVAVAFSALCVWLAFRGAQPAAEKLAVLLCGMILAAAHVGNYDAILLGIAALLVLSQGLVRSFRPGEAALAMAVWAILALNPPFLGATLPVFYLSLATPLLVLGLMLRLLTPAPIRDHQAVGGAGQVA